MANNSIPYDRSKPLGKMTGEMVDLVAQARSLAVRLKAKADEMGATGGDGSVLEDTTYFGVATGKGTAFYVALSTLRDNLNGVGANGIAQDKLADLDLGG